VGLFAGAVHDPDPLRRAVPLLQPDMRASGSTNGRASRWSPSVCRWWLSGSWLGDRVIRKLDPQMFCWLVSGLILLSGIGLLVK